MDYAKQLYGAGSYGLEPNSGEQPEYVVDLMRYLPQYWQDIEQMKALQKTLGIEAGLLWPMLDDLLNQFYIETATWGLDHWETVFGLAIDRNKSYEYRRERVKSKIRGAGTATKQMVINIASAFAGGEAEVIEYPKESRFVIKFVGLKGIPPNIAGLTAAIEEIKPAHLAFTFEYTYNYWDALQGKVWNDFVTLTWEQARVI